MSGWRQLDRMGGEFLVGGVAIAAVALAILLYDNVANGGTEMVITACVLFLWLGAVGVLAGLVLRMVARSKTRSVRSPFSPGWRPPPAGRARYRR